MDFPLLCQSGPDPGQGGLVDAELYRAIRASGAPVLIISRVSGSRSGFSFRGTALVDAAGSGCFDAFSLEFFAVVGALWRLRADLGISGPKCFNHATEVLLHRRFCAIGISRANGLDNFDVLSQRIGRSTRPQV